MKRKRERDEKRGAKLEIDKEKKYKKLKLHSNKRDKTYKNFDG